MSCAPRHVPVGEVTYMGDSVVWWGMAEDVTGRGMRKLIAQFHAAANAHFMQDSKVLVIDTTTIKSTPRMADAVAIKKEYEELYDVLRNTFHTTIVVMKNPIIRTLFNIVMALKREKATKVEIVGSREAANKLADDRVELLGGLGWKAPRYKKCH